MLWQEVHSYQQFESQKEEKLKIDTFGQGLH